MIVGPAGTPVLLRFERPGDKARYEVQLLRSGGVQDGKGVDGAVNIVGVVFSLIEALREEVSGLKDQVRGYEKRKHTRGRSTGTTSKELV